MSVSGAQGPIVNPPEVYEGSGRPKRLSKRVTDCYNKAALGKEVAGGNKSRAMGNRTWSKRDESILKKAVLRSLDATGEVLFDKLSKELDLEKPGRTGKQLREKWVNDLHPNSLGGRILKDHRESIKNLCKTFPRKWAKISNLFTETILPNKRAGQYYSQNAIKNFFNNSKKRKQAKPFSDENRSSSATTTESQEKIPSFDEIFEDQDNRIFEGGMEDGFSFDKESIALSDLSGEALFLREWIYKPT